MSRINGAYVTFFNKNMIDPDTSFRVDTKQSLRKRMGTPWSCRDISI